MPALVNDHSNFRIYTFKFTYGFIGCDQKRGLQKFIIHISSWIIFNFKWLFLDQLNLIWILSHRLGGGGGGVPWLLITDMCINDTVVFLSFCRYILTSKEDIRWDSGITSGDGDEKSLYSTKKGLV